MSDSASTSDVSFMARLSAHLRTPLYRNAYALVVNSATTSVLGVAYWLLAARSYSTEAIGLNSATLSTMIFLATLSQLNLGSAMNRFIPSAGQATGRLVVYAYVIVTLAALATSGIFLLGVHIWAPTLSFWSSNLIFVAWFTVAIMAWCIFSLQDGVLIGLRQSTWVPVKNIAFSLAKIALLLGLVQLLPLHGVFASWTIPAMILLVPTDLLIFRRLIPQHVRVSASQSAPIVPAQIVRYVAGDYAGSIISIAATSLLPIIVTERLGATTAAYFYLPWTVAYSLYLVSFNMGMSLIAEGSADPTKLDTYSYRLFVQMARLLVPAVIILVVGAPYILRLFGQSYAEEGTLLLRLLSLSALPEIIVAVATSVLRVQRRIGAVVLIMTVSSVASLGLSLVLLNVYGIVGIGVAFLVSQTAVAIVLVCTRLGTAWLFRH